MQSHQTEIRTYAYQPVRSTPRDLPELSGLEVLERVLKGQIPPAPIASTLEFQITHVQKGISIVEAVPQAWAYNPLGVVHGGYTATLLDTAVGCAVHTALPAGVGYTTLELKVSYVRALTKDTGPVRVHGKVQHVGTRVATAEAHLISTATGKLHAHATTTCLLIPFVQEPSGRG